MGRVPALAIVTLGIALVGIMAGACTREPGAPPPASASPSTAALPGALAVPSPTAVPLTATPPPTACPSWSAARGPSTQISHGSRSTSMVALTFDAGGRTGDAVAIVDWLVRQRVPATLFMTGEAADGTTGRRILAAAEAHPDLLVVGNRGDGRAADPEATVARVHATEIAIGRSCGLDPRPWFRPPDGAVGDPLLAAVGAAGYAWTVAWDVDPGDARSPDASPKGPTASQLAARVVAGVRGGSIVRLHLGGYETLRALPAIVTGLRDAGYVLIALDGLL